MMPPYDDSAPTWCATGPRGEPFHNVTAAQLAEFRLTVTHCPDHDADDDDAADCAICPPGQCPGAQCPGSLRDHDCPKQRFLDDPITVANGVGSEMVGLIDCPICDAEEAGR